MIREYIGQRKRDRDWHGNLPEPATINRELSILREAFNLALEDERISYMPSFKKLLLDESGNVRKGFLKDHQYEALAREAAKIGLWMRAILKSTTPTVGTGAKRWQTRACGCLISSIAPYRSTTARTATPAPSR